MDHPRFACSATFAIGFLAIAGAPCCGGKTEDLVALDGTGATGGAGHSLPTGGAAPIATGGIGYVLTGGAPWAVTGGALWAATGGAQRTATGGRTYGTGGTSPASTTVANSCTGISVPSATGTLSITSGYVTTGSLKGYGYTYVGELSNEGTCVVPKCGNTGCSPPFGASALCAAGVVGSDFTYNSLVGVGFNLNQSQSGANDPASIPAPNTVTVAVLFDSRSGNAATRVALVDDAGVTYCVEAGSWTSGLAIKISQFNTTCWDGLGEPLRQGTPITALHLMVPSDATMDRPFGFCIEDVAL